MRMLKWLYPGMHIKRWIVLCALGIGNIVAGTIISVREVTRDVFPTMGVYVITLGIILLVSGVHRFVKSLVALFRPLYQEKNLADMVYKKRQLARGPRLVVIGGGTGLSVLLSGLKQYTANITAIVTVTDDGGSSGRLREQFNILPPGDIRNCLVALADTGPLLQELFQFRFPEGTELAGHNFGNLFITAMTKLTGGFDRAIKESSRVLAISGSVIPSTLYPVELVAEHEDGGQTCGETNISNSRRRIKRVYLNPDDCQPTDDALAALQAAEIIILGPGSLFTSVLPNLMIKGVVEAINRSAAPKLYICNVMTQAGETDGFTAFDHVRVLLDHTHEQFIDYCLVNAGRIPPFYVEKYRREHSQAVVCDSERINALGITCLPGNYISTENYVRHNAQSIAQKIMEVLEDHRLARSGVYV